jgi:hypothetical protein
MKKAIAGKGVSWAVALVVLGSTALSAQTSAPSSRTGTPKSGSTKAGAARGTLPDPVLLDGSNLPAEKRPEHGMIGDFELPGDENARTNRVGGPSGGNPNQTGGGPQVSPPGMGGLQVPGAGGAPSLPQLPDPLAQQGGGGGPENPAAAGQRIEGAGQPGAQPQGAQVGQLQGEGGGPEQGAITERPPQVSIGDQAMQIQTIPNPASIVGGTQPAGKTQQHEKTPGTGGKAPPGSNANKGVERGRAIPAGL